MIAFWCCIGGDVSLAHVQDGHVSLNLDVSPLECRSCEDRDFVLCGFALSVTAVASGVESGNIVSSVLLLKVKCLPY